MLFLPPVHAAMQEVGLVHQKTWSYKPFRLKYLYPVRHIDEVVSDGVTYSVIFFVFDFHFHIDWCYLSLFVYVKIIFLTFKNLTI